MAQSQVQQQYHFNGSKPYKQMTDLKKNQTNNIRTALHSRALPHTDSQISTKEHVKKIFHFMCDLETIPLPNYRMPGGTKFLVHCVLDHLGSVLQQKHKHINSFPTK
jgi:adenine C2-methylase RlmN of 23S rRNA A2503 and tRNA A37